VPLEVLSFVPGQEFEVLTVSFDSREMPALAAAKKKAYMARYRRPGAHAGWHFLTGSDESIAALTRAVGFRYVWDEATRQFAHPAGVVVLTPEAKISHYLFGVEYAPKDLRLALVAAASGRIGNAADQLLLYCYSYDPQNGRFSASILNIVRLLAVLTVVGLAAFILTASAGAARGASCGRPQHLENDEPRLPAGPRARVLRRPRGGRALPVHPRGDRDRRARDLGRDAVLRDPLPPPLRGRPAARDRRLARARAHLDDHPAAADGRDVRVGLEGVLPPEPAARTTR
jgi:hypothetical protein